jgi:hypothetical protein
MSRAALAARQQVLLAALVGGHAVPAGLRGLRSEDPAAGLRAYRRHAQALADKALAAVFPRLRELLGEAQFAAMAWAFWRQCPPQGELGAWGQDLPGFLSAQPGMDEEPPVLARLEWALHLAERAADAELDAGSLQLLGEADPARLALRLRPGLQLLPPRQLVWRRGWRAQARELPAAQADFIGRLLAGRSLGAALEGCLAEHTDFDFAQWLQQALQEEWLMAVTPHED